MSISTQYQNFSNVKILTILLSITLVSVGLTLYTVDFSINPNGDNFHYALHAIEYANGDFFISSKSNPGWSLFLSPFTLLIDSNDLTDYVNLSRILTIIIGSVTIFVFYGLARKFFNIKYSITAASLFAFEPHLNYISGQGLGENLLILLPLCTNQLLGNI